MMDSDLIKVLVISPAIIGNILLAFLVLSRNRGALINRVFFLIGLVFGIWSLCLLLYEFPFVLDAIFWIKATYVSASILEVFVLMFSFVFPVPIFRRAKPWAILYSVFFLALTFYLLYFTKFWVVDVVVDSERGLQTILGSGYLIWTVAIWGELGWAITNLFINIKRSSGSEKTQALYLMLGFALFGITATITDIIVPLVWHDTSLFPFSTIGSLFFTFGTAYVIVKHRFMDLRFAFQQVFIYSIQISLMVGILAGGAYSYWFLTNNTPRPSVIILLVILAIVLTLTLGKLQNISRFLARKFLFQSVYDYQQTLRNLSLSLSGYLEMPKLVEIIIDTLLQTMRLNRVAVLVRDFNTTNYRVQKTIGFNEENGISLVRDNFLTSYIEQNSQVIVLEEINRLVEESKSELNKEQLRQLKDHMIRIEAALLIPILNHGKVIGLVVLGDKISGDPYSVQDVDLLRIITSQASVALENARLYQEVSQLNQGLQLKVNEATSELQKRNVDLSKAFEELKSLDKMKDQLIAIASHELRTPASNVQNYLWMMLTRPQANTVLDSQDKDKLNKAFTGIQNLIKLINDILDVSMIEGGKLSISLRPIEYSGVLQNVVEELTLKAQTKGLSLSISSSQSVVKSGVMADPLRFKEILTNLVVNALKYTEHGGVVISVSQHNEEIVFAVRDSGRGIAPENLGKVFDKFYREDSSLSSSNAETGGTGLGLYITKSLVDLMQGRIWVESTLGEGSVFYVALPAVDVVVGENLSAVAKRAFKGVFTRDDYIKHKGMINFEKKESLSQAGTEKRKQRILLVEDEPEMRSFYADFLLEKYEVETAKDGEEGLAKLRLHKFDLVLLDIMMPHLDGVGFLERKQRDLQIADVPVILLTNMGEEKILEKCFDLGAKSMIMKSDVTPDEIIPVIEKVLTENPSLQNYSGPALAA